MTRCRHGVIADATNNDHRGDGKARKELLRRAPGSRGDRTYQGMVDIAGASTAKVSLEQGSWKPCVSRGRGRRLKITLGTRHNTRQAILVFK
jgi:hypothetical protein